jgi:hypothetical protein
VSSHTPSATVAERYAAWNRFIADEFFAASVAGSPAYLDVDDDFFSQLTVESLPYPISTAPLDEFLQVVRSLVNGGYGAPFQTFEAMLRKYDYEVKRVQDTEGPPPVVGILAVFVLAASRMNRDGDHGANAYYPHLQSLLEVASMASLQRDFREVSEWFWRDLEFWLIGENGRRGVPSATAISHRYVGLPISQSLIRSVDRQNLPQFFRWAGLSAGSEVAPITIAPLLREWLRLIPGAMTPIFRRTFNREGSQEQISLIVANELEAWDGTSSVESGNDESRLLFSGGSALVLRRGSVLEGFRWRAGLLLNDVLRGDPKFELMNGDEWSSINATFVAQRKWRLDLSNVGGGESNKWLLESRVSLREVASNKTWIHAPRQILIFVKNYSSGAWEEVPKAPLAREVKLLIRAGSLRLTEQLLDEIAREGWSIAEQPVGIPEGWELIEGIEILRRPKDEPRRFDLKNLIPDFESQLALNGGFRFPGILRCWHALRPPEIVVVVQDALAVRIRVTDMFVPSVFLVDRTFLDSSVGIVDLSKFHLPVGNYRVEVSTPKGSELTAEESDWTVLQNVRLQLIDPSAGDFGELHQDHLERRPDGEGILTASTVDGSASVGLTGFSIGSAFVGSDDLPPEVERWIPGKELDRIVGGNPPQGIQLIFDKSVPCFEGGYHVFPERLYLGSSMEVAGAPFEICRYCGLHKRWPKKLKLDIPTNIRFDGVKAPVRFNVEPLRSPDVAIDWEMGVEALAQLGSGSGHSLELIAAQLDEGEYFPHDFGLVLEMLGYIEAERDVEGRLKSWAVTRPHLVRTAKGYVLAGRRSKEVESLCSDAPGVVIDAQRDDFGPSAHLIRCEDEGFIADLAGASGMEVVDNPRENVLKFLRPLSGVLDLIESRPLPQNASWDIFELETLRWASTGGVFTPGGYRCRIGFVVEYYFIGEADLMMYRGKRLDSSLVRYAAARLQKVSLLSYDAVAQCLRAPLGAQPPRLFGRLAVVDTLGAPRVTSKHHEFVGVHPHTAASLNYLLMN